VDNHAQYPTDRELTGATMLDGTAVDVESEVVPKSDNDVLRRCPR
jgi:hypothetical protein